MWTKFITKPQSSVSKNLIFTLHHPGLELIISCCDDTELRREVLWTGRSYEVATHMVVVTMMAQTIIISNLLKNTFLWNHVSLIQNPGNVCALHGVNLPPPQHTWFQWLDRHHTWWASDHQILHLWSSLWPLLPMFPCLSAILRYFSLQLKAPLCSSATCSFCPLSLNCCC